MLVRYTKAGMLIALLLVLAVEVFLVYGHYERYYGRDAGDGSAAGSVAAPEVTTEGVESSFVHRATDQNSRGDYTYLSGPGIDGDPGAVILATPTSDRESTGGAAYDRNIGVWYESRARKWAVFNQDRAPVPAGASFEVVVPQASEAFVHRAELVNTVEESTYLDDPLTNDKPDAVVSVTQNWNPGGGGGVYNDHPVGVRYDEDVDKWTVYNKDGARVPDGAAFNVAVSGDDGTAR